MPLAIEIQNLSKTYSNGTKALQDINLEIEQGDFFALLGANGAGKTTIIGVMTSLVNKTAGTVKISGVDIDQNFDLAKTYIGVVPQEFNFSIFEKVIDIVVNQGGYYGIPTDVATKRATVILTKLGLKDKMNVVARTLSGGMKRRLMIARALIHEPRILVLDEPTAGVDVELRIGMWEYLNELNADGVTILLTTHYLEEVEQLCKNAAIIKSGQIVKQDSVRNLLNSLDQETYQVEVDDASKITELPKGITKLDDHTFEAIIQKGQGLNSIVSLLDQSKIQVLGIRPKGNRLEELFLNIIGG
jgi:ABC-2 type transport system ATP-binding protein